MDTTVQYLRVQQLIVYWVAVESFGNLLQDLHGKSVALRATLGDIPFARPPTTTSLQPSTILHHRGVGAAITAARTLIMTYVHYRDVHIPPPQVKQDSYRMSWPRSPQTDKRSGLCADINLNIAEQLCATMILMTKFSPLVPVGKKELSDLSDHM